VKRKIRFKILECNVCLCGGWCFGYAFKCWCIFVVSGLCGVFCVSVFVSKEDVREFLRLNIISQIVLVKEKLKFFERKYGCSFEEFERRVREGKEVFEEWDDYIEWKAYVESLRDLEEKLGQVENAKDIKVA